MLFLLLSKQVKISQFNICNTHWGECNTQQVIAKTRGQCIMKYLTMYTTTTKHVEKLFYLRWAIDRTFDLKGTKKTLITKRRNVQTYSLFFLKEWA